MRRPRDPPSVWPDHQHILYSRWRPAPPPKQRLKARPHGRAKLTEQLANTSTRNHLKELFAAERTLLPNRRTLLPNWLISCRNTSELCSLFGERLFPRVGAAASSARELWSLKSLLNGIPKFVLKIGQNLNFTAFHLDVKVSEFVINFSQHPWFKPLLQGSGCVILTVYLLSRQLFKLRTAWICVCDVLAQKSFCLKCFCVCVMYRPYKSFFF